jgi:YjjI family glycine radical enzyme
MNSYEKSRIEGILQSNKLQYHEKRANLAREAEDMMPYLPVGEKVIEAMEKGILHDMNEGHRPFRPRYILPDYVKFMKQGSKYLNLDPPQNFYDAVNALMIIYKYVPSITGYPVYVGQIDDCLEPFADTVTPEEMENLMKMLLIHIDRTLPSAFVHMNIGPKETRVGRLVIKLERELGKAIPNVSLKYDENITPDSFALEAIESTLNTIKPYFVNHRMMSEQLGEDYGIVSCFNTLRIGGGAHTLCRLNMKEIAKISESLDDFMARKLPEAIHLLSELVNAKSKYIVEESRFFEGSFLAVEGLIDLDKFTTMPAIYGLFECVELLTGEKMGHSQYANDTAEAIVKLFHDGIKAEPAVYCGGTGGKHGVHAQGNIESDVDVTPGARIRYGDEPAVFDHLKLSSKLHPYFDTGCSDIYLFEETAKENLSGMLTIIKGAIRSGIRILSCSCDNTEFIRITGYLVKKSDIDRYFAGAILREDSVALGSETVKPGRLLERKVRKANGSID